MNKLIYFEELNNISQFGYVRCHIPSGPDFWFTLINEFNDMDIKDPERT